ncbi:helix-turn-helix transcriptional regulator [Actinokineospora iranica]|nr:helix-turn-helix transcriptional regulator [Actinokineospora iranica]
MTTPTLNRALLRRLRVCAGLSVTAFARQVGCHKGTVSAIEHGHRGISPEMLTRFAQVLDRRPEELLLDATLDAPQIPQIASGLTVLAPRAPVRDADVHNTRSFVDYRPPSRRTGARV